MILLDSILKAKQLKQLFKNYTVYDLIDYFGILLFFVNWETGIGEYRYINKRRIIIINQNLDENMKRCVLFHELGHALCHRTVNCYYMANKTRLRTSMYEIEAEQFAAEMLLPDHIDDEMYGRTAKEIAAYYGVTENLVKMKWGK